MALLDMAKASVERKRGYNGGPRDRKITRRWLDCLLEALEGNCREGEFTHIKRGNHIVMGIVGVGNTLPLIYL